MNLYSTYRVVENLQIAGVLPHTLALPHVGAEHVIVHPAWLRRSLSWLVAKSLGLSRSTGWWFIHQGWGVGRGVGGFWGEALCPGTFSSEAWEERNKKLDDYLV